MTNEASGETQLLFKRCGATLQHKCPACAKVGRQRRIEQAKAGWHRSDEPLPAPELNDDQAALLRTRVVYEFLRQESADAGRWLEAADLDQAIGECEQQMRAAGRRGRIPAQRGVDPAQAAQWQEQDAGLLGHTHDATVSSADAGEELDEPAGSNSPVAASSSGSGAITARVDGDGKGDDAEGQGGATGRGGRTGRRSRSTRRRQDAPNLPRKPVADRTIGRTFTSPQGRTYRPSTLLTLTLPSYGRVRENGTPLNPNTYDYAAMARDAVHFPAGLDRFYQNLRRAEGWNVQYFGALEPQRRLAPHAHFAIRGAIPRQRIRQVVEGTYKQIWWPSTDQVVYEVDGPRPVFDHSTGDYRDPHTGKALPTWDEALDAIGDDAQPYHVLRFGSQMNIQGVPAASPKADQLLGYLNKYILKSVDECHPIKSDAQAEHFERFRQQLSITPCSEECANWLRYGIQPKNPERRPAARVLPQKGAPAGHARFGRAASPRLAPMVRQNPG